MEVEVIRSNSNQNESQDGCRINKKNMNHEMQIPQKM